MTAKAIVELLYRSQSTLDGNAYSSIVVASKEIFMASISPCCCYSLNFQSKSSRRKVSPTLELYFQIKFTRGLKLDRKPWDLHEGLIKTILNIKDLIAQKITFGHIY